MRGVRSNIRCLHIYGIKPQFDLVLPNVKKSLLNHLLIACLTLTSLWDWTLSTALTATLTGAPSAMLTSGGVGVADSSLAIN